MPLCQNRPSSAQRNDNHNHIHQYKDAISLAKTTYYSTLMKTTDGNTRVLFSTINNILKPPGALPPHPLTAAQCDN